MQGTGAGHAGKIPVRGVIFDYGNVLCYSQSPSDVEGLARVSGMNARRFQELYWKFRLSYDRGDFNGDSYWNLLAREQNLVFAHEQIEELILLDAKSWSRKNEGMMRWLEQLHVAGIQLALLSNMPLEISRYLAANGDWARLFQHLTFSCDVHRVKPEPEIYRACLEPLQLAPEQVLFLDDIAVNVKAASDLGMNGLVFDTAEQTFARVSERFDLPVPDFKAASSS